MEFDKQISKLLAKLMFSSLVVSSVGCVSVSAMEQEQSDAVKQMMWELDNSILPFMARRTKLDFLNIFLNAMNSYITDNSWPHRQFDIILNDYMNQYHNWYVLPSLDTQPFPSLSPSRREDVMKNIKKLCDIITRTNRKELKAFCTMIQNELNNFIHNPLKLCKQHAENDKSYDLNS